MPAKTNGITLTSYGQPRPYADLEYVGTVEAENEAEARAKLAKMRGVGSIRDRQDPEDWHMPYFREFAKATEGSWDFLITEAYTG